MQRLSLDSARIGVLVNPSGECDPQLAVLDAWAREHGHTVVDLGTSARPNAGDSDCELIVALGGDGTILRALQLAMVGHAAVLGVNFGHVGFLADVSGSELAGALAAVARGEGAIAERTALVTTIPGQPPHRVIAFNDVVVNRQPGYGAARLRVEVGDESLFELRGDGVVIASPTGSTAYTVGAGGPAVAPSLDAIVLTPLAAQGSPLRSLVIDGGDALRVVVEPSSAPLTVEIDGRTIDGMPEPGTLEIHAAPRKARLVRTRPRTFYRDLADQVLS